MPKHVINMLDDLLENGANQDLKVLGAGLKETLQMLDEDRRLRSTMYKALDAHIKDAECHTPKGLLVRKDVIGWAVFIVVLITGIMQYVPELVAWLKAIP